MRASGSRGRRVSTWVCIVLGVVLTTSGVVLASLSHGLFDAEGFADRTAASLADDRVGAYVADRVTSEVVAQEPDLMPFRPILVGATEAVVTSEAFRAVVRQAALRAHRRVFSEGGRQILLSIPDADVLLRNALANAKPELAEKISSHVGAEIVLPLGRAATAVLDVWQFGQRVARLTRWAFALGGLLIVLGVVLAQGQARQRAVLLAGTSLLVAGLVLVLSLPITRFVVASFVEDPLARQGLNGVWDVFTSPLKTWAYLLGGLGLVTTAAAGSLLEWFDLIAFQRWLRRMLVSPPGGTSGRLIRGALVLAAGLVTLLHPTATLHVLAATAGALLVFWSLLEIFRLLSAAGAEVAAVRTHSSRATVRTMTRAAAGVAILALVGLAVAHWARRTTSGTPTITDACNGASELCDRRLDEVVFPCTHNAMSSAAIAGWMFPEQERSVADQLRDGIRALMLDAHYGRPVADRVKTDLEAESGSAEKYAAAIGQEAVDAAMRIRDRLVGQDEGPRSVYLCHGFCELGATPLTQVLEDTRQFMVENPNEVIILIIEDYVSPGELAAQFEAANCTNLVYRGRVTPPWPTLHEVIADGQRLLVFSESGRPGVEWIRPAFDTFQETPYTFHEPEEFSCVPNRGGTSGSLFMVNHWIETAPTPLPSNAAIVNAYDLLLDRVRSCEKMRKHRANVVAVDFYRTGDLFRVVRTLNGLDRPQVASPQSQ